MGLFGDGGVEAFVDGVLLGRLYRLQNLQVNRSLFDSEGVADMGGWEELFDAVFRNFNLGSEVIVVLFIGSCANFVCLLLHLQLIFLLDTLILMASTAPSKHASDRFPEMGNFFL